MRIWNEIAWKGIAAEEQTGISSVAKAQERWISIPDSLEIELPIPISRLCVHW
jgi:hypothetical protein